MVEKVKTFLYLLYFLKRLTAKDMMRHNIDQSYLPENEGPVGSVVWYPDTRPLLKAQGLGEVGHIRLFHDGIFGVRTRHCPHAVYPVTWLK